MVESAPVQSEFVAIRSEFAPVTSVLEFPYTRTTGPVIGPFLTGLRDGVILGRRIGGRVYCPPLEYDPADAGPAGVSTTGAELVEVGPGGTVEAWTWVSEPAACHPFDHPFAFALITLDGADTPLVHAVDAGSVDRIETGARVAARFAEVRVGAITDVSFVPERDAAPRSIEPGGDPVVITTHPIALTISEPLHAHRVRMARGLLAGRFIGQRSPASGQVTMQSRGYDPIARVELTEADDVEVATVGTISEFTVITPVRYHGQKETEPYIRASIVLDGADSPISLVDIRNLTAAQVRVGLRVRAVWRPVAERRLPEIDNRVVAGWESLIARWEPTGEPDDLSALGGSGQ